eukprot:160016_1
MVSRVALVLYNLLLMFTVQSNSTDKKLVKIVVVGDTGSGKTSLAWTTTTSQFPTDAQLENAAQGDVYSMDFNLESVDYHVSFFDTNGDYEDKLRPLTYPETDIYFVCFDLTNALSFEQIKEFWVPEITHYTPTTPFLFVGAKTDLRDPLTAPKSITDQQAHWLARECHAAGYVAVSSLTGEGISQLLRKAIRSTAFYPPTALPPSLPNPVPVHAPSPSPPTEPSPPTAPIPLPTPPTPRPTTAIRDVIIHTSNEYTQAGFCGREEPNSVFVSVVGRPRHTFGVRAEVTVGEEGDSYPVQQGVVVNWVDMEKIWHHALYNELRVDPTYTRVLITEAPLNSHTNREKTTQIMFEDFEVDSFYLAPISILALYASGKTRGVVIHIDDDITWIVPIMDGLVLEHAVKSLDIGSHHLITYFKDLLNARAGQTVSRYESGDIQSVLESIGYFALDFEQEQSKTEETIEVIMDDSLTIIVGNERFEATEALFQPTLVGSEHDPIHLLIKQCLQEVDVEYRAEFYLNIELVGDPAMMEGFTERLKLEIEQTDPSAPKQNFRIKPPRYGRYTVWMGASIVSSLSLFDEMWIQREEYDEEGPGIVHFKCNYNGAHQDQAALMLPLFQTSPSTGTSYIDYISVLIVAIVTLVVVSIAFVTYKSLDCCRTGLVHYKYPN